MRNSMFTKHIDPVDPPAAYCRPPTLIEGNAGKEGKPASLILLLLSRSFQVRPSISPEILYSTDN